MKQGEFRNHMLKNEDKGYIVSFRDKQGAYHTINENTPVNFYKDVAKDDYQVLLGTGENYNVDHDTWTKLYDFTVWGVRGPERKNDNGK